MSLRPTSRNTYRFRELLSCASWTQAALESERMIGDEGFSYYCDGDWFHYTFYRKINNENPRNSPVEALEEMSNYMQKLISEIQSLASDIDDKLKRLSRMENEMVDVVAKI